MWHSRAASTTETARFAVGEHSRVTIADSHEAARSEGTHGHLTCLRSTSRRPARLAPSLLRLTQGVHRYAVQTPAEL